MFFDQALLCRRSGGKFAIIWIAATRGEKKLPKREILSVDVERSCDDIMEFLISESRKATSRFSLRLTSQLTNGLIKIYQVQVDTLLTVMLKTVEEIYTLSFKKAKPVIAQRKKSVKKKKRDVRKPVQEIEPARASVTQDQEITILPEEIPYPPIPENLLNIPFELTTLADVHVDATLPVPPVPERQEQIEPSVPEIPIDIQPRPKEPPKKRQRVSQASSKSTDEENVEEVVIQKKQYLGYVVHKKKHRPAIKLVPEFDFEKFERQKFLFSPNDVILNIDDIPRAYDTSASSHSSSVSGRRTSQRTRPSSRGHVPLSPVNPDATNVVPAPPGLSIIEEIYNEPQERIIQLPENIISRVEEPEESLNRAQIEEKITQTVILWPFNKEIVGIEEICVKPIKRLHIALTFNGLLNLAKHLVVELISEDDSCVLKGIRQYPGRNTRSATEESMQSE